VPDFLAGRPGLLIYPLQFTRSTSDFPAEPSPIHHATQEDTATKPLLAATHSVRQGLTGIFELLTEVFAMYEFVVVLPECQIGGVLPIPDRLRPLEIEVEAGKISFSYSVGRTDYRIGETPAALLRRVDRPLCAEEKIRKAAPSKPDPKS
jgi:hypothetical protein